MASTAMNLSLSLLLALLLSSAAHARDSHFFNKIPSTTNNVVVPAATNEIPTNQHDPNFLPETENSYGLYGHESGQDPPSAAATTSTTTTTTSSTPAAEFKQPVNKYLPKNYNPVAYVTQPESANEGTEFTEERSFSNNPETTNSDSKSNYYNGEENYYNNNQQQEEAEASEFRRYPTTTAAAENDRDTGAGNYYYAGGSSFNSQPQGQIDGRANNRGGAAAFQPQGMSDTRYMENGKYFYDLNSEKYSSNHPYESLRGARAQNEFSNRNFYANNAQNEFNNRNFNGNNAYDFNGENSVGGYQNQEEFENMP